MAGPASFTGEDVVELHIHGGARNVRKVVDACLRAGAVAAGPGDFSRRAFELGKLTLDQAEGVAALIGAQTDEGLRQARRLVAGELGTEVESLRERVAELRAEIEANLDFPEDVEEAHLERWRGEAMHLGARVCKWLQGFEGGRRARERARLVLAGPPNAGKSTLFNALLGHDRAIVADRPGTTRDYLEAELEFGVFGAVLIDTAGLRDAEDPLEADGVSRSRGQVDRADLVLWIEASTDARLERPTLGADVISIESKRDLACQRPDWVGVSLGQGRTEGLTEVREGLQRWFEQRGENAWIGLTRHKDRADEAWNCLRSVADGLGQDIPLEAVAFELAVAEGRLAEVTGRNTLGPVGEDVLARIFSTFCIGK